MLTSTISILTAATLVKLQSLRSDYSFDQIWMETTIYTKQNRLDIKEINGAIDFYAVTTESFNLCGNEFRNTGCAPMNGDMNHTLDKLKDVLQQACIPIEKTYFKFRTTPTSPDNSLTLCDLNYEKMCTQPQVANDWCSDTQSSYNEKGQYAQKYGVGFMVIFIDYDDPGNCCNCDKPYPAFHAILDGFNGVSTKTCDLLKRP